MMTTASIDTYNAASALSGEAASRRLSEVGASSSSGGTPLPPSKAAVLFQRSLAEQAMDNGALEADLRAAMVSVSEILEKVAVTSGREMVAVPAVREPLPQQVAENVSLGEDLSAATALGEAASRRLSEMGQSSLSGGTPLPQKERSVEETPEATADALVAAGVATAAAPTVPVAESAPTPVVAPVDVARIQSAEAVSSAVLVQAAEAVADTLLVTPGLLRGQGEVLVRLRPDVLDGTEVKISVTGRQLDVVFQPQTVDMAVMIENCRVQLVQHLAAKIVSFNVSVDVRKKSVGRA